MKRTHRQQLGQHFLRDKNVLKEIIRLIDPQKEDLVVEIGPGKGILTHPLINSGARVAAIEKDPLLFEGLMDLASSRFHLIRGDAIKVSLKEIVSGKCFKLVGNLPYSISGPLLFRLYEERSLITRGVFLLQKEVAERICAGAGTRNTSSLSILLSLHYEIRQHRIVPPGAFSPPPKVDSALVRLDRRPNPVISVENETGFAVFLRAAFRHRRKTLLNNLKAAQYDEKSAGGALQKAGLGEKVRAEQLSIEDLTKIFAYLQSHSL